MRVLIGFFSVFLMGMAVAVPSRDVNYDLRHAQTLADAIAAVNAGATDMDGAYREKIANGWQNKNNRQIIDFLAESGAKIQWSDLDKIYSEMLMSACSGAEILPAQRDYFLNPDLKYDTARGVRFMLDMMAFSEKRNANTVLCLLNVASQNGGGESELSYAYDRAVEYNNVMAVEIIRAVLDELKQIKSEKQ